MSTYYATKLNYIIEDLKTSNFDFLEEFEMLKTKLQEKDNFLWNIAQKIHITLSITTPDTEMIHEFYEQGQIKSHELTALIDKVTDMTSNAIKNLITKLHYSLSKFSTLKNSVSFSSSELSEKDKKINTIELECSTDRISIIDLISIVRLFQLEELAFSEQISFKVYILYKGKTRKQLLLETSLEKKPLDEVRNFVSIDDLDLIHDYLGHKYYYRIFNNYIFPNGADTHAEITLDIAKEDRVPQKRRTVSIGGTKMKFHQTITKTTPHEKFTKIIKENNIIGIYCSTKCTKDSLLYFLIDIDVPSVLYSMFTPQVIWELTLNTAKAITRTALGFNLPCFLIIFSGAKGIHLLLSVKPDTITDIENYVSFPEIYDSTIVPGIRTLKKEAKSSISDKFKFAKSFLQSLLLYTVYKGAIEIPPELRYKLRINHPYQLYCLSPEVKNLFAILLDCSSMGRGVFRLFSPHPTSKLISIPIFNVEKKKFSEPCLTYTQLLEEAKIENVIEKFNSDNVELFLQKPNQVNSNHITHLLRPDKLYPSLLILLRFGTIHAIERTPASFNFWYRFYELKSFYSYIENQAFHCEGKDLHTFFLFLNNMGIRLHIQNIGCIISLLKLHLVDKKIKFPVFRHKLNTLYYIEFFSHLKSAVFFQDNEDQIVNMLKSDMEFTNFLNQTKQIFNIAIDTLLNHIILEDISTLPEQQITSIKEFYTNSFLLVDLVRYYIGEVEYELVENKEEQLIKAIYFVIKLYSSAVKFVRAYLELPKKEA